MRIVGLTGSIATGKSTTAAMFRAHGVPVHDADAAVHRLYDGGAVAEIEREFPGVTEAGTVNRARLAERLVDEPAVLERLEAIVHPMVRESQAAFIAAMRGKGHPIVIVDVPLLFETGGAERVDAIVVATVDSETQRARVLARAGMTEAKLRTLLSRQIPDAEKRRRAHFLVDSGYGLPAAGRRVAAILRALAFTL